MITDFFIRAGGLTIHVRESGKGIRTILFIHGNSCTAEFWDDQLNDEELQSACRLIAIDLPGHGNSERASEYSIETLSVVLKETIELLISDDYILAGLSYGTALIAETAPELKKCKGYFLCSPNITNNDIPPTAYIIPFPELMTMVSDSVPDVELKGFIDALNDGGRSKITEMFLHSYKLADPKFRTELGQTMASAGWADEFMNLENTGVPVCYVFGVNDKVLNIHYMDSLARPANQSIATFPSAGHFVNNDRPAAFNIGLVKFANLVFGINHSTLL